MKYCRRRRSARARIATVARVAFACMCGALPPPPLVAQPVTRVVIDAVSQPTPAESGFLRLGSTVSPSGHTIGVTSRYLTRDGAPWLPVMGEFHFSRYPADRWEDEIVKMKSAGVQVIASYIIWIHHEEVEGEFDWTGQRDLHRFVTLCAKHGMLFDARIGPWSHAEVRNGGLPDWLLRRVGAGARSDDTAYMAAVTRFYGEIGRQLRGQMWKEGGPVIGVQLENEYLARGPARGAAHLLHLKQVARDAGLDAPLYTITGWDNAVLPPAEFIPVFGGYPDWPWDASIRQLPPNEVYQFRFANRVAGDGGAQGPAAPTAETSPAALARYPFLGAEFAGGIMVTYHRRPVVSADDIAAMGPVQVGSGVNLLGYYMFHGGTNPEGRLTTLNETQATGYPTDLPVKSYDFQAPLSEFGEMRESLRRIKPLHLLLESYGDRLAPMVPRRPDVVPENPADASSIRLSARTLGDRGFLFVNNHVRQLDMPVRRGVQVELRLPSGSARIPLRPIDVPPDAYFIWPVNMELGNARLAYATVQPLTTVTRAGSAVHVFFAVAGVRAEFAFDTTGIERIGLPPGSQQQRIGGHYLVTGFTPGTGTTIRVTSYTGAITDCLVLTAEQARDAWVTSAGGVRRLVLTKQQLMDDGDRIRLRATGAPAYAMLALPALGTKARRSTGTDGVFARYAGADRPRVITPIVHMVRAAASAPPVRRVDYTTWRHDSVATPPDDSLFASAATWEISIAPEALRGLPDAFLEVRYTGDIARLYSGTTLLDDDFATGRPWRIGLARYAAELARGPLTLRVMPLRGDAPVYIPTQPPPRDRAQVAEVQSVRVEPAYDFVEDAGGKPR